MVAEQPRPRKRVLAPPPLPVPAHPSHGRWPNGAELAARGGGHYGWTVEVGGRHQAWARTGPGDGDALYVGEDERSSVGRS